MAAVLLVPAIAALAIAGFRINDLLTRADRFAADAELSRAQQATGELVSALGREQLAATAVVIGEEGDIVKNYQATFAGQQNETDEATEIAQALVLQNDSNTRVYRQARTLDASLRQLDGIRQATTDRGDVLVPSEIARAYNDVAVAVSALGDALADAFASETLRRIAVANQSLSNANRESSLETTLTLVATTADTGSISDAELRAGIERRSEAITTFERLASEEQQGLYSAVVAQNQGEIRAALLGTVLRELTDGIDVSVTPVQWSGSAIPTAGGADALRRSLFRDQIRVANDSAGDARRQAAQEGLIVAFLLLIGLAVAVLAARSIYRPLQRLETDARAIIEERLPEALRRINADGPDAVQPVQPVRVTSTEEIGRVARAMDDLHTRAIRGASDQQRQRIESRDLNDLFINLSRRSQSLVSRQLAVIDQLEANEQDPDQLGQLFRLDHLAARMRRNNYNLMVLASSEDSGARSGVSQPMSLHNTALAALSEVEQFKRVTVAPMPEVTISARAASDVVHLLAEIIDNATVYSPPHTEVLVSATRPLGQHRSGDNTGVEIKVEDHGLGVSARELGDLNTKLSNPPVLNRDVTRQMGLFVVSHLARRHGLRVRLVSAPEGMGTTAYIEVPLDALTQPSGPEPAPTDRPSLEVLTHSASAWGSNRRPIWPAPDTPEPAVVATATEELAPPAPIRPTAWPITSVATPPSADIAPEPLSVEDATPIFAAMSMWFRDSDAPRSRLARGSVIDLRPDTTVAGDGGELISVGAGNPSAASSLFASQADAGWKRSAAVVDQPSAGALTQAGLPKRTPQAHLIPGSAGPEGETPTVAPGRRDAERARSKLSGHQRGLQSGRRQLRVTTVDGVSPVA